MNSLIALVTGVAGFAGSHLAKHLLDQGLEVRGIVRPGENKDNIAAILSRISLFEAELTDPRQVNAGIREIKPDLVFHLAAQASVGESWENPAATLTNNILGQLNLLQALVEEGLHPRVLIVGSYEEYGLAYPDELPISEENPLRPTNPYAISKIAQDMMGYQYYLSHDLPCVRVRPFNHLGPGQSERFAAADFARRIAEAEAGLAPPLMQVGNLEAKRDFTDVRDVARAYYLALRLGQPGEVYNVGSGRMVSVGELLDILLSHAKISISVERDPSRLRPLDVPVSCCDYTKLHTRTGWVPEIPLERSLEEILDYWRERVAEKP